MKKRRLKQSFSGLLAAVMALSAAAPAMQVHAAAAGKLVLDITSNNPGVFDPGSDIEFSDDNGAGTTIPLDGYLTSTVDGTRKVLPFLPEDYLASQQSVDVSEGATAGNMQAWVSWIKDDYKVEGWYDENNSFQRRAYFPATYPYGTQTMKLSLSSKGNKYFVKYNYITDGAVYLGSDANGDNQQSEVVEMQVLQPVNKTPKNIDGFKLDYDDIRTSYHTVAAGDKSSSRAIPTDFGTDHPNVPQLSTTEKNFTYITASNQIKGYGIPVDVKVDLKYVPDQTKINQLLVRDVFLDQNGNKIGETVRNNAIASYYATQDITPVRANDDYTNAIAPEVPRYRIESVELVKPGTTTPLPGAISSDGTIAAKEIGKMSAESLVVDAATKEVSGKMVNYPAEIRYTYRVNPDYSKSVSITYVDDLGNNITDKVIDALGVAVGTQSGTTNDSGGGIYKDVSGQTLMYKIDRAGAYRIPAPTLTGYMGSADNTPPSMSITTETPNVYGFSVGSATWGGSAPYFSANAANITPTKDLNITVKYTADPNNVKKVQLSWTTGGKITVPPNNEIFSIANTEHVKSIVKSGTGYVVTPAQTYEPAADPGYEFRKFQYQKIVGTTVSWVDYALGDSIPESDISGDQIRMKAVFEPVAGLMNHYYFTSDDVNLYHDDLITSKVDNIANVDAAGNAVSITLAHSMIQSGGNLASVTANPGFRVAWFAENGATEITSATDIRNMSGITFVARAVPDRPVDLVSPNATGNLDAAGTPSIQVDTANPSIDPRLQYVITDANGNVVANIPGNLLIGAGGKITGDFLTPSYPYKLYTVDPATPEGASVATGFPLPAGTQVSDARDITIPATAIAPAVSQDPADPVRFAITVAPTTPNTEYELVDTAGNVIKPFKAPGTPGGPVVFADLDPMTNYIVVPRRAGSNDSGYPENGTTVSTSALTPLVLPHPVIYNSEQPPTSVKLNGSEVDISALASVAPGTEVEITADSINMSAAPFNPFSGFSYPSSITNRSGNSLILNFEMPNHEVQVNAMYLPAGVVIDAATPGNATRVPSGVLFEGAGNSGATFPNLPNNTPAGQYRLHVTKGNATNTQERDAAQGESNDYHALFAVQAQVEVWNGTAWEAYTGAVGPISLKLDTGSTNMSKQYSLKELDGAGGSSELALPDADFNSLNSVYPGYFTVNTIESGKTYVFGYTTPVTYRILLRSNRVSDFRKTIQAVEGSALIDYAVEYNGEIGIENALPGPDGQGLVWTYKGLSSSSAEFIPVDENLMITEDATVFIYFESDRDAREDASANLSDLISKAYILAVDSNLPPSGKAELQAAITAARAVLDQASPRKSSTAELKAALLSLKSVYDRFLGIVPDPDPAPSRPTTPGVSGGGGGRISGTLKAATAPKTYLTSGIDGSWQLIDEKNHTWIFNLKDSSRVKGWNQIAYTYEGKTRVDWYYFNSEGIMLDGWFFDESDGHWYYLNEDHDGFFGHLTYGWHNDPQDGKWYYLDPSTGAMHTGWDQIGGKWYYLNPTAPARTYFYSNVENKWIYDTNVKTRPLGSMYASETTPDGYRVNASGAWVK